MVFVTPSLIRGQEIDLSDGPFRLKAVKEARKAEWPGETRNVFVLLLGEDERKVGEIEHVQPPTFEFLPPSTMELLDACEMGNERFCVLITEDITLQMRMFSKVQDVSKETTSLTVNRGWRISEASIKVAGDVFLVTSNGIGGIDEVRWRVSDNNGEWKVERLPKRELIPEKIRLIRRASESVEGVRQLLDSGYDIDARDEGNDHMTVLMRAAGNGDIELVNHLIKLGGDINLKDDKGRSVLSWAVKSGSKEVVKA